MFSNDDCMKTESKTFKRRWNAGNCFFLLLLPVLPIMGIGENLECPFGGDPRDLIAYPSVEAGLHSEELGLVVVLLVLVGDVDEGKPGNVETRGDEDIRNSNS